MKFDYWRSILRRYGPRPALPAEMLMQFADVKTLREKDRGHFLLAGATGSGKSTLLEILMESILAHPPHELDVFNAFVFDPQNDFYRSIMGMNLPMKTIQINVMDGRGWAWDMWRDVRDPAGAWQFAHAALPDDPSSNDNKFYSEAPRHIFAAVLRELVNRGMPWSLRLAYLIAMDDAYARQLIGKSDDPGVRQTLRLFDADQGSTKANISSSLLTKLSNLETYAALAEHARRRFSVGELIRSDVVAIAGGDFQFSHIVAPMNNLFLTVLKNKLIGQEKSDRRRHYIFIDEFAALNNNRPADEVLDFFVRGRSRGVRIAVAVHTPEQLVDLYGPHKTEVILGQCQNKILLKMADVAGSEWCSKMLGQIHEYEWTANASVGATRGKESSSNWSLGGSETYADRPIVHPDEIRSLPLASFETGIHGYGILPGPSGVDRWKFHLTPGWLAEHAVRGDERVASYESRRRPGRQQRLKRLSRAEVEEIGLEFRPDPLAP
ncbi:type IV secretion system DNA-binding domain-containing protein [Paludisphaera mucosa]|uniref:Type IV secretion system DNA-binding domain-containing protein n=1 Tax=Paludisphaera mucosa TaxID=3030827 RepID=A0ABT6FLN2_9BACT|nr:type IV secretion system DNA-binding domain-containing protein [Paludisphaera mucosa]MDG3008462.1 type IV secretion system DNA-binding domain-containing protein [Paludisphaera mucosa]